MKCGKTTATSTAAPPVTASTATATAAARSLHETCISLQHVTPFYDIAYTKKLKLRIVSSLPAPT